MDKQIELEQWLLGSLIVNNSCVLDCDLTEDDFLAEVHKEIYTKICSVIATKKQCTSGDLVVWANDNLTDIGELNGFDYIRGLVDAAVGIDVSGYVSQIKELSRKANVKNALNEAIAIIETHSVGEVLAYLDSVLKEQTQSAGIIPAKEVKAQILSEMDMPRACHLTGLEPLDKAMGGGLYEGYTYGLCGPEKSGKTTLAHTISYNLKCPHLYIAMEMGMMQIEQRNIARDLNVNSLKFLNDNHNLKNSVEAAQVRENVFYLDCPGAELNEIIRNIGNAILRHGIKGFILDYWQLVTGHIRGENEERHLRYVAQSLANFARKQGVWCILLAQMNKEGALFGGNGLRKACDQLYMIQECTGSDYGRWLRMDASRYTFRADVGSKELPAIALNTKSGPYFHAL